MVRGAPTTLACFYVGFCTYFVASVRVPVAFAGILAPPPPPPPSGYVSAGTKAPNPQTVEAALLVCRLETELVGCTAFFNDVRCSRCSLTL